MDAMQPYFVYAVITGCGIPSITLEGTTEDWEQVRQRAKYLEAFDLKWWIPHLMPLLDQCVDASRGQADRAFWQRFYKEDHSSGGPYIRGHIVNLFPYLGRPGTSDDRMLADLKTFQRQSKYRQIPETEIQGVMARWRQQGTRKNTPRTLFRNPYLGGKHKGESDGLRSDKVASTLSIVPFIWDYGNKIILMEFIAGFVGAAQNSETFALRPEIGWAVRDRPQ
jgi:hypothetical protein